VLVHRLPLAISPLCSVPFPHTSWHIETPKRISPLRCAWLLQASYFACLLAAVWAVAAEWLAASIGGQREFRLRVLLSQLGIIMLIVLAVRLVWFVWLRTTLARGACFYRIFVFAESAAAAKYFAARIERRTGFRLRAAFCGALPGLPGAPTPNWVEGAIQGNAVDRVVLIDRPAMNGCPAGDMFCDQSQEKLRAAGVNAIRLPLASSAEPVHDVLALLTDFTRPLDARQRALKRSFDIVISATAALVLLPFLLAVAAVIKADSHGPALFSQKRVGLNNQPFLMWKFRTMHAHLQDENGQMQTSRDDARVTRLGRLLRRSSLDELPQLYNVLRGDMSMVGPRPHTLGMKVAGRVMNEMAQGYAERHTVKPGITGWAQVNGCRGEVNDMRKLRRRVALDCHYIENWSFMTDLNIILRTTALLVSDNHAY
jgi:exopolysaccharide biosynthesis polyprenyl glycosylphosphotransferase